MTRTDMERRRRKRALLGLVVWAAATALVPPAHGQVFITLPPLTSASSLRTTSTFSAASVQLTTIATARAAVSTDSTDASVSVADASTSASSTAFVSGEGDPKLVFAYIPTLTACRTNIISWSLVNDNPRDVALTLYITNKGVTQAMPASLVSSSPSSTSSTLTSAQRRSSLERRTIFPVNSTIATSQPALSFLTWTVNVPEGQYYIGGMGSDGATGQSANFYVVEGDDTSCLAAYESMTSSYLAKQSAASASASAQSAANAAGAAASASATEVGNTTSVRTGWSQGAIAGTVVGVVVFLLAAIGALLCLRRRRKRNRSASAHKPWTAALPIFRSKRDDTSTTPTPWIQPDTQPNSVQSSRQTIGLGGSSEGVHIVGGSSSPKGSDEKKRARGDYAHGETYDLAVLEKAYPADTTPRNDSAPRHLPATPRGRSLSEALDAAPGYSLGTMGTATGYPAEKIRPYAPARSVSQSSLSTSEAPATERPAASERPVSTPSAIGSPTDRSGSMHVPSTSDDFGRPRHGHPKQRAWGSQGSIPAHMLPRLPVAEANASTGGEGADLFRRPSGSIRRKPVPPLLGEIVPIGNGGGDAVPAAPQQRQEARLSGSKQYILTPDQPLR